MVIEGCMEERSIMVSADGMLVVMVAGTGMCDAGWVTMVFAFGRVRGVWPSFAP
jgi:hypothetical protein